MKIVLIGPVYPYRGGIAHYTSLLAQALDRHQTTQVISFRRQYPSILYPGQSDKDPSQAPLQVTAEYLLDPLYPWTWVNTARSIVGQRPDVVVITWWTTFWGPALATLAYLLRRRKIKVLFLIHNVLPHETRPWDSWLARLTLGQGDKLILLSQRERLRLATLLPRLQAPAVVVPIPVYKTVFGEQIPKRLARCRLGQPLEGILYLFFGIVRPYKGLDDLIQALAILKAQGITARLLVAGEIWEGEARYHTQVERLGLQDQVVFENRYIPNEDVGLYFSAADGFVAPYVDGTQSAALKLALGFDLAVILTEVIAQEDIPEAYQGRLFRAPPRDANALAQALADSLAYRSTESRPAGSQTQGWESLIQEISSV